MEFTRSRHVVLSYQLKIANRILENRLVHYYKGVQRGRSYCEILYIYTIHPSYIHM